jgi:hypothetical protein
VKSQETSVNNSSADHNLVEGAVYYAVPGKQPLFWYQYVPPPGQPETNIEFAEHIVPIRDARRAKGVFRLDVEGAAIYRRQSAVRDFYDEDELCRVGYPEAAAIAKTVSGAKHAFVFDHNVRRAADAVEPRQAAAQKPVFHIHTDFTTDAAPVRARDFTENSAAVGAKTVLDAALTSGCRFAVINIWRPIVGPVRDTPLALVDASSVSKPDLLAAALLYPERKGEIYYVRFNAAHRWWYLSDMQPDEVWVFKNYDSANDGRARFTPHTAFIDTTPARVAPRESIEFRTFVVFDS